MAGFVIAISKDSKDAMIEAMEHGIFGMRFPSKVSIWQKIYADYMTMAAGNHIYLFSDRMLYGVGRLINIKNECRFWNIDKEYRRENCIHNGKMVWGNEEIIRCFFIFEPAPYFFKNGIDMDELLHGNPPEMKMLPAFNGRGFVKIDDEEDALVYEMLIRKNKDSLCKDSNNIYRFNDEVHNMLKQKDLENYILDSKSIFDIIDNHPKTKRFNSEAILETIICDKLNRGEYKDLFGVWNYISRQVIASPLKPSIWADAMDIFGYEIINDATIENYPMVKARFMVAELKKDEAGDDVIPQLMKYVDWIRDEYAHGDYGMIDAYIIARSFNEDFKEKCRQEMVRKYVKGYHTSELAEWDYHNVKLVSYEYTKNEGLILHEEPIV